MTPPEFFFFFFEKEKEKKKRSEKKENEEKIEEALANLSLSLAAVCFRPRLRAALAPRSRARFGSLPRQARAPRLALPVRGENGPVQSETGAKQGGAKEEDEEVEIEKKKKRTGGGRRLAGSLGGELLARGLAARGLASRLLGTSHCFGFGWGFWKGEEGGRRKMICF